MKKDLPQRFVLEMKQDDEGKVHVYLHLCVKYFPRKVPEVIEEAVAVIVTNAAVVAAGVILRTISWGCHAWHRGRP